MTEQSLTTARADRSPGMRYSEMLEGETRPAPAYLVAESATPPDDEPLDPARYISEDFAAAERERLWPNIWHFAAREDTHHIASELSGHLDPVLYQLNVPAPAGGIG